MKPEISKEVLFDYLAGRANPVEKQLIEAWIRQDSNTPLFHQWLLEWERRSPQFSTDTEQALGKLMQRINQQAEEPAGLGKQPLFSVHRPYWGGWLAAAMLLFLLGTGVYMFRNTLFYQTYQTVYAQTKRVQLEDGSIVALNANSSLRVPRFGFSSQAREVWLAGEAEFFITHRANHQPFIVQTPSRLGVEVLGTVFTVSSRSHGTQVMLHQGKVRINYANGSAQQHILMEPGDLVTLDQKGKLKQQRIRRPDAFAAWKEHQFIFDETSVAEICTLFQDNFGVHVKPATESIGSRTITGNFQARSAKELLNGLKEVLDLEIQSRNDTIILSAK